MEKPEIVCLCGSTRFKDDFIKANEELSLQGKIVLSVGLFGHADGKFNTVLTEEMKIKQDFLHKQKIDLCDSIYVLNVGNYIGSSTKSEIEYAMSLGKTICCLERTDT